MAIRNRRECSSDSRVEMHQLSRADVQAIIRAERWFGHGTPRWESAPTKGHTIVLSKRWQKRLRRKANGAPPQVDQLALAATLKKCRPGHRCAQGHCPICGRAFQRWAVALVLEIMGQA
jgi:hypothetical protein